MDPGGEGGKGVRARPGRNVPLARRDRFRRGHQGTPGKIRDSADLVLPVPREVGTVPEGGLTLLPTATGKGRLIRGCGGEALRSSDAPGFFFRAGSERERFPLPRETWYLEPAGAKRFRRGRRCSRVACRGPADLVKSGNP